MYKDKPLVISRPWWRHPIFPWGWYRLSEIPYKDGEVVIVDGHNTVGDNGGGIYRYYSVFDDESNRVLIRDEDV